MAPGRRWRRCRNATTSGCGWRRCGPPVCCCGPAPPAGPSTTWAAGCSSATRPAGRPAGGGQRRPRRWAALLDRQAAACAAGWAGQLAAAADDHAAGRPGHLVCGHGGRDGADQRLCLSPGALGVLLRARAVQAGAGAAGQRRGVGRGGDGRLQRRGGLCRAGQREGGARATRPRPPARWCRGAPRACCRSPTSASRDAAIVTDVVTPELIEEVMGEAGGRPADPHLCGVQQRAAVPDRPGRAGPGRAGPRRRVRPVVSAAGVADRHRLGRPDADRGGRVPGPRRHRHLLHPVRPVSLVPVGPEGGAGPGSSGCCSGGSSSGWPAGRPSGARRCWSSARAWAPGPARTS